MIRMMVIRKTLPILFCISAIFTTISCSEESNPEFDKKTFLTIFDNNKFDASYFPIDMRQTPDGGYIVLGGRKLEGEEESDFTGIYLMKADQFGNFVKEMVVASSSVNPVADFTEYQTKYHFICMDANSQQTQIASVDANLESISISPVQGGITYPAAASFVDNNFVVVGYNNGDKQTVISIVNPDGGVLSSKGFSIGVGEDVEKPILQHYLRTGKQYPFEAGKATNGLYFFNGFYNYTFSLVFTDMNADDPIGIVEGQREHGGFSALTPLNGNRFASARFNFGENYLLPGKDLQSSGITSSTDLGGYNLPELVDDANVRIVRATIDTKNVLIYGSDTRSKQIALLYYDESTGVFISSRYLGFSNPFEIASITQTADGGLAICGRTYLAGRFPRICIFKITREEVVADVNQ
ncbi:MAG: hypothetical protein WKF87_12335 [Chryseolinea sp.]